MLNDWAYWVAGLRTDELLMVLGFLLLVDAPRYAYSVLVMAVFDCLRYLAGKTLPGPGVSGNEYQPTVTAIIAGYNESETIAETIRSVIPLYPKLQVIVVDDGSTDNMAEVAQQVAREHSNVVVMTRSERGGKSSALNMGLQQATGEVVVTIDADSHLSNNSITELIQPLKDPSVAAVSASVLGWNSFTNLCTWLQAYEYRQTIFLSRMVRGRTGVLGIVSGAFGAFRTSTLKQLGGWDVGPGEDGDLVLRIRKAGYDVKVASYANCHTNVPTSWVRLFWQRCRWDRTVITFECRKHSDLARPFSANFRWSNLALMMERWFFNVVCVYTFWLYGLWVLTMYPDSSWKLLVLLYLCGLCVEFLQALGLVFYSDQPWKDLRLSLILPLYPAYQVFMKAVNIFALTSEIFFRDSGDDNFVPKKVRIATWRW